MQDIIPCPECGSPAQVTDRFRFGSTDGPVEHLKTGCVNGHWLTPLAEMVEQRQPAVTERDPTPARHPRAGVTADRRV
jgi:hypothetical protein